MCVEASGGDERRGGPGYEAGQPTSTESTAEGPLLTGCIEQVLLELPAGLW